VPQTENISAAASHRVGPGAAGDWLSLGRFALGLAVLIFAAFPQVLLGLQTFVVRDFGFFAFPLAHYQRECFWRAQLPLWNPYNNCGVPFLAQWNTMPLYPPALIYLLLPLEWSLSFFSLLHLFWAGLGMYCLARRWTGHRLAAAVAGLIFAFNGLSLNLLMWPSHMATLSWMPWVVLTVERAWEEGRRQLVLAALVGALQMLAGGPETILFTWLILLALWASRLWRVFRPPSVLPAESPAPSGPSSSFAALWRFPLVVVLVAALAAVQLLPFLDLAAHSQRDPGFADARWSMPAWGWMNFLVPMVYGSVWNKGLFFQYNQAWTSSYYLGVGGLLLALLGVWVAPQRRRTWLLAAAGTLGLALALGDQVGPVRWLRHRVPQLSLMTYPVKFVTVAVFAAPLLAAFGLARLQTLEAGQRREFQKRLVFLAALLLALIAGILLWAWRFPLQGDDVPATLRNGLSRAAFLVATAFATGLYGNFLARPLWFAVPVLAVASLVAVRPLHARSRALGAFAASCAAIVLVIATALVGLFPDLIPSSLDSSASLTAFNSSSGPYTLRLMAIVAAIFVPIVIVYQFLVYRFLRSKLTKGAEY